MLLCLCRVVVLDRLFFPLLPHEQYEDEEEGIEEVYDSEKGRTNNLCI
jgi:hypothetical protein